MNIDFTKKEIDRIVNLIGDREVSNIILEKYQKAEIHYREMRKKSKLAKEEKSREKIKLAKERAIKEGFEITYNRIAKIAKVSHKTSKKFLNEK